jgi:hypothetical protein
MHWPGKTPKRSLEADRADPFPGWVRVARREQSPEIHKCRSPVRLSYEGVAGDLRERLFLRKWRQIVYFQWSRCGHFHGSLVTPKAT